MKNLVIVALFLVATANAFCQQVIAGYRVVDSGTGMYQDHKTSSGGKTLGEAKWAETGAQLVNASGVVPDLKIRSNGVDLQKIDSKNFVWMCDPSRSQWTHIRSYSVSELKQLGWWNSAVDKQELVLLEHSKDAKIMTFEKEGIVVPLKKIDCENLQYFKYTPKTTTYTVPHTKVDTVYVVLCPPKDEAVAMIEIPDSGFDPFMSGFKTVKPTVIQAPCYPAYYGSDRSHYEMRGGRWFNLSLGFWVSSNQHIQPVDKLPVGGPGAGGGDNPGGGPGGGGGDNPGGGPGGNGGDNPNGGGIPNAGWGHN